MHTHKEDEEVRALHIYCRLFVQRGPWFKLDNLYGRYYAVARGGVGHGWLDANTDTNMDSDTDEEGEAREGGNLGKEEELIGRGGDDTVDAAGGCGGEGSKG